MRRIQRLLSCTAYERRLLLKCLFLLLAVRLALWMLPFGTVRRGLARGESRGEQQAPNAFFVAKTAWAVSVASRYVPRASCLTQALAGAWLLRREGQHAELVIGVMRTNRDFKAHAWVVSDGRVVIGWASDLARYTALSPRTGQIL
jgi:hypothetical protein